MRWIRNLAIIGILAAFTAAQAQERPVIRAAMEAAGTFSWIIHGMDYFGTDILNGITVEGTFYASKPAVELALLGGEADVNVGDFLAPVTMRDAGIPVTGIYSYATNVGGLVVPTGSDVSSVADLRGRTVAAGSVRDKSVLILRALTISQYGFDVQEDGEIIAAAAPLMQQLIANGEVDAGLPLWHFTARIEAAGQGRDIMPVADMLAAMGLPGDLPNLVVIARDELAPELKTAFIAAMNETVELMKATPNDDPFWQSILDAELYSLPDPSLFPAVVDRWRQGTPDGWTQAHVDGLVEMVERLVELAGAEVVGVESVPTDAYSIAFNPR